MLATGSLRSRPKLRQEEKRLLVEEEEYVRLASAVSRAADRSVNTGWRLKEVEDTQGLAIVVLVLEVRILNRKKTVCRERQETHSPLCARALVKS